VSAPDHLSGDQFGPAVTGYKLFDQNPRTGNLHPLFVDKKNPVPLGEWLPAHDHTALAQKAGLQPRPGWHAATKPSAPHLMSRAGDMRPGRVWAEVEMPASQSRHYERPESQGGDWLLGGQMRVNRILEPHEHEGFQQHARQIKAAQAAKRAARGRQ
jgi:hypothetical protein